MTYHHYEDLLLSIILTAFACFLVALAVVGIAVMILGFCKLWQELK